MIEGHVAALYAHQSSRAFASLKALKNHDRLTKSVLLSLFSSGSTNTLSIEFSKFVENLQL